MLEGITLLYRSSDLKVNFPFCQGDFVTLSENTTYNNIKHEASETDFMIVELSVFSSSYHVRLHFVCLDNHWFQYLFFIPHPAEHHTTWEPSGHIISLNALNGPGPEN